jgi:hypothetical protein
LLIHRIDGIIEASKLCPRDVQIINKEFDRKDIYIIEARHPESRHLLGFICWKNGTLEFCNFGAQLKRSCLEMGVSSKRQSEHTAGTHGEGFKIASLVMLRNSYKVRYEASSYYWTFNLGGRNKDLLYCRLSPMGTKKLGKQRTAYSAKVEKNATRQLKGNIWEDVTVKIGKVHGEGNEVTKADFEKWISVSLDLDRPAKMIHTSLGDLILDDRFRGKLYLKGLLLEGQTAKPFRYGYNFLRGEVNRDRERLVDPVKEAEMLADIWDQVTKQDDATLPRLIEMLQADQEWADVNLADDCILKDTAKRIWSHLCEENLEGKRFYYFAENGDQVRLSYISHLIQDFENAPAAEYWIHIRTLSGQISTAQDSELNQFRFWFLFIACAISQALKPVTRNSANSYETKDVELITQSLRKEPYSLKRETWTPLRRYHLIRTPEEQRNYLLENAPASALGITPYSEGVRRALRSILALDPETNDFELDFRSRPEAELDILLKGNRLLINDRWLDFHQSHTKSQCSLFTEASARNTRIDQFTCGHVLNELYSLILVELSKGPNSKKNKSVGSYASLRLNVSEKVLQMPVLVEALPGEYPGQIRVSWVHLESQKVFQIHRIDPKGRVTLHRESTCAHMKECLLSPGE